MYTLSLLSVHVFVVANRQLSLDKFQVPAKIAMSSIVPVAMAMTARVGTDAVVMGKNAFSTVIYISRDDKLDLTDYIWTTIPHTTGKPTDSVTYQGSHFLCCYGSSFDKLQWPWLWHHCHRYQLSVKQSSSVLLMVYCTVYMLTKFSCNYLQCIKLFIHLFRHYCVCIA